MRQDVTGCVIGATYQISGWMRGNSTFASCTVKVSPTASTSWATAINLSPAATYTGGMTAKRWGRVGDTPIIGAGTWAEGAIAGDG